MDIVIRKNPYNPTYHASDSTFVGREVIKRQLVNGLRGGLCFEVIGGAGIGKTSLLWAVYRELTTKSRLHKPRILALPIYVDCMRHHSSIEAIISSIVNASAEALSTHLGLDCPPEVLLQAIKEGERGRLEIAMKCIFDWAFIKEKQAHLPI